MNANQVIGEVSHLAIDMGGDYVKAQIVFTNGQSQPVRDPRGELIIRNAILIRPDTGELVFGEAAIQEGYEDPNALATNYKVSLGDPAKKCLNGTASAEDCARLMAGHVKELAEKQVGQRIPLAVVTMPQNFPDAAKRAACAAVEGVIPIIPEGPDGGSGKLTEPVAAALAYGNLHGLCASRATVGVFDYGSTTLDCCILQFGDNAARVLGAQGVQKLGAFDLQAGLERLVLERAVKGGLLTPKDAEGLTPLQRHGLRVECAKAVQHLSQVTLVRIPITLGKKPGAVRVAQKEFEEIVLEPEVTKALACFDQALEQAKLKAEQLDYLVPVGGPCLSPYVQARLARHCNKKPSVDVDQLRAVVIGAGLHGHWLLQRRGNGGGGATLPPDVIIPKEVVPHHVALVVANLDDGKVNERAHVLFPKGTPVPAKASNNFRLLYQHSTGCQLKFVQAPENGATPDRCATLGETVLNDLPLEQIRSDRIQITGTFDSVGMVEIEAVDRVSGKRARATFNGKAAG